MSKQRLVKAMANAAEITLTQAEAAFDAAFTTIKEAMLEEGNFIVPDFGSFGSKRREARTGRNPATGEILNIPAKQVAYFKPATKLKKFIEENAKETA